MKVLITGGAGFIGSHLSATLLKDGHEILVIDNFNTGNLDNLKEYICDNLIYKQGTIVDESFVENEFDHFKPEIVIHAAASYKNPDDWQSDIATNVNGTANIVKASLKNNINRLIYFQTALCYGLHPLEQPITTNHPLFPDNSSYAISKVAGEEFIKMSGLDYISFRLANIIGPKNLTGPVAAFYQRLKQKKSVFVMDTRRDLVYVMDLIAAVVKAVNGMGSKGVYHISSGSDFAIIDVFHATQKAMGVELDAEVEVRPRNPDDAPSILLDPSKTNKDFDWSVSTSLDSAVKDAVKWYELNGLNETYSHLQKKE